MKFKEGDRVKVTNPRPSVEAYIGMKFVVSSTDDEGCSGVDTTYFYFDELSPAITRKDILKRIKEYNDKVPFVPLCND